MKAEDPIKGWRKLYEAHAPALLLYVRNWVRDVADAEDVVQEAFVRCWRARAAAETSGQDLAGMLYAAARFAALDRLRSQSRRAVREETAGSAWYAHEGASEPNGAVALAERERAAAVEAALGLVPEAQREVVVMRVWGDLSFRQIAEALGLPLPTVTARYRYGLRALERALQRRSLREAVEG